MDFSENNSLLAWDYDRQSLAPRLFVTHGMCFLIKTTACTPGVSRRLVRNSGSLGMLLAVHPKITGIGIASWLHKITHVSRHAGGPLGPRVFWGACSKKRCSFHFGRREMTQSFLSSRNRQKLFFPNPWRIHGTGLAGKYTIHCTLWVRQTSVDELVDVHWHGNHSSPMLKFGGHQMFKMCWSTINSLTAVKSRGWAPNTHSGSTKSVWYKNIQ